MPYKKGKVQEYKNKTKKPMDKKKKPVKKKAKQMATKKKKTYSGRSGRTQYDQKITYGPSFSASLLGSQKVRSGAKSSKEYLVPRKTGPKSHDAMSASYWDSFPSYFDVNIKKGKKKKK